MNKKIKKHLKIFLFLAFLSGISKASLLWDINYGINLYQKNSLKSASEYFADYIISNPNDEDGYYWLAKTYDKLKDSRSANENFKKAHEIALKKKNIEKIDFNINTQSNVEDYFDMAAMYFEAGDLKQANMYADLMLKVNPKSSSAYFVKAKIAQIEGDEQKAKDYINQAIIFNNKLIKTNLAKSLNIRQLPQMTLEMYETFALEAYFSSDIKSAIRYLRKYLDINPNNIEISNLLIDCYIKNDELFLAQNLIDSIMNLSNNIQTILYQAKIYQLRNDERLETTLLNAYKINPNNSQVLLELGNYYLKKQDYLNSKRYFEILINVDDGLYEGYFGYILSLAELKKTSEAMSLIRKISQLNNETSELDYLLAKICYADGNLLETLDYLNIAIDKAKNPNYYSFRAQVNYELKNYDDSISDLKMISKLPNSTDSTSLAEDYLIKNYLKINDLISAQMYLNKKTALDKNRIMYKYNLYVFYKLQGNEKIAEIQLENVKKAKPQTKIDYIDLSEFYLEEKKPNEAIKILDKGIKKFKNEWALYSQIAKIYTLSGKNEQAKLILEKYIQDNY